jgi:hypothetical protein
MIRQTSPNQIPVACVAAVLVVFAGCGSSDKGADDTSSTSSSGGGSSAQGGGAVGIGGSSVSTSGGAAGLATTAGGGTMAAGGTTARGGASSAGGAGSGGSGTAAGGMTTGLGGAGGLGPGGGASGGAASGGTGAVGGLPGGGGTVATGGTTLGVGGQDSSMGGSTAGASSTGVGGASGGATSPGAGGTTGGTTSTGAGGADGGATSNGGTAGATSNGGAGGAAASVTIVPDPSWTCGMPDGIVDPTRGELVMHATVQLGDTHEVGLTQYGERRIIDVTGGTLTGDQIDATFLEGGLSLELSLSNGSLELEEIEVLRASDSSLIYLRTCGVAPAGDGVVRIVPDFEVANSSALSWLNTGKFAGTRIIDEAAGTLELDIYDVSAVAVGDSLLQLEDPAGVPNQPWDCSTATGGQGASVFTETVTLGDSLSVGASKRGSRNIVPITGGTVTGRVTGSVLSGGADYQLTGSTMVLDARYALESDDGEFILVRNCGPFGALVPLFETQATGSCSFLNANTFISSDPGGATGGVSITFYERN